MLDVAEEEVYAGAKIDSEAEAEASELAVHEALEVGAPVQANDTTIADTVYTIEMWRVQPEQNAAFVAAWHELADAVRRLRQQPAGQQTLVQSIADPDVYYSFAPWRSLADVEAVQPDVRVQSALATVRGACVESTAGAYRAIAAGGSPG
jgi:hypothetical protein